MDKKWRRRLQGPRHTAPMHVSACGHATSSPSMGVMAMDTTVPQFKHPALLTVG
jgi:hypothetical protein